ncbi:hypothetical protein BGZ93_002946 [Podila epicladia]|nr:hypothetical protein BGZ92_005120 [Podila epicladia]KAG0097346.1 hypothetical protein BGZ93_002946 [Podila epicladia]
MKVLCIGDSLTAGYIDYDQDHAPYTDHLDRFLDHSVTIHNAGVDGETVPEIEQRLGLLLQDHYDVVVLLGGTNDLGGIIGHLPSSVTADTAVSHISFAGIYSLIQESQTTRALIQLTVPFNAFDRMDSQGREQKEALNRRIQQMACVKKIVLDINHPSLGFNYFYMTEQARDMYFEDSLHYTAKGYQRLAECVFSVLSPILESLE